ncbi:MAG: hypothetical protein H7246_00600 [Phycisphaerae bacterium]|nr:hypothetical protein [Saprospiraceae bacterium]
MRPFILIFAGFLLLAAGCVQYHYSPNFVQTPYVVKKGDGMVTAAISGSPVALNGDFHASYSPIKYGTVMLNYFQAHSSFTENNFLGGPSYLQTTKGYLVEGAVGAYKPFSFGTAALYVGWGQGQMRNDYGINRIADLGLQRFFVQPTFTYKNDWFRLGIGLRFVRLNFPSGNIDYRIEPADVVIIQRLEKESPFWFPEMGGNIGIHFKPVTISANLVIMATRPAAEYSFDASNIGVGLSLELQELFKKRNRNSVIEE